MAQPISNIKQMEIPDDVIHEQNMEEILMAVGENKEAILKGIDLLATINENGFLDMANAFVKHKEDALDNVMRELNKEQYAMTLENLGKLILFVGELPMDDLQYFSGKLNQGIEEARTFERTEKTSHMDLWKSLKDPEINKSITMLLQFLRGMGRG